MAPFGWYGAPKRPVSRSGPNELCVRGLLKIHRLPQGTFSYPQCTRDLMSSQRHEMKPDWAGGGFGF